MPVFVDDYFCIFFSSLVEKNYNDEIWLTKALKKELSIWTNYRIKKKITMCISEQNKCVMWAKSRLLKWHYDVVPVIKDNSVFQKPVTRKQVGVEDSNCKLFCRPTFSNFPIK